MQLEIERDTAITNKVILIQKTVRGQKERYEKKKSSLKTKKITSKTCFQINIFVFQN